MNPLMIYDGDCGFCTSSARLVQRRLPTRADVVPWQQIDLARYGLTSRQANASVQWVGADGRVSSGAAAVGRLLVDCGGWWRPLGWLTLTPPFRWAAEQVYRAIAANRHRLPGGTPACALSDRPGCWPGRGPLPPA